MVRVGTSFVLHHVVDAFGAQTASGATKAISVLLLVSHYFHVERHFTGRQGAEGPHAARRQKKQWPVIPLSPSGRHNRRRCARRRGRARPDLAVDDWCRSVCDAFAGSRSTIVDQLR
jgi:hypothetical protein